MSELYTFLFILLAAAAAAQFASRTTKYPPLIVKQPDANEELLFQVASNQAENDKPFIIECEASGEPAPEYRWKKNGKHFDWQIYDNRISQNPGSGTLVITSPRVEDLGEYQCFATNELGVSTSNSVFVRKSVLNSFKPKDPDTVTVEEGKPIGLPCQPPDGYPKPSVYWMLQDDKGSLRTINNTRMTVDPEGMLWFSNVTREDKSSSFTYACSATSPFRNEYKLGNKVYLKVERKGNQAVMVKNPPVEQFRSRRNTVILKGKTLRLWCIYSGTPLPQIKWTKKDGVFPHERVDYENYGKTLVISYVDFSDAGSYDCEASNGVGSADSYSMNVDIQAIPEFIESPEIQNKAEGETAVFTCSATGKPQPKIRWIYNGMPIEQAPPKLNRRIFANKIEIFNLSKIDTGNYGCNSTNEHGYVYRDSYVNVLALPPEIRVPPSEVRTVEGKDVNMTCRVFGAPQPRVTWIRDENQLTGGRYNITEDGDLIIHKVSFTDKGEYLCIAVNKFGEKKAEGSLDVKRKTTITDKPTDYEVIAGSTATFRCSASADESLVMNIDWMIDGKIIDFEQEPRFVKQSDNSLSITETAELDSGNYTCLASTELDKVGSSATLIVQDVPNAPQLALVTCNDKDASIEWRPMGDNRAPIMGYGIQYNTSFSPDSWEYAFENYPPTSLQVNVEMSPWANYTFRVLAKNKIGLSKPSRHSIVCTTPEDVPHKNPDGVQGRGNTPNNLVIKWSPMLEIDHNGPGFKYRVYWKRSDVPGSQWQTAEVVDWEKDFYIVESQPTFKPYKIKVEAHNELGQAQVAAVEIIGYSGEDVPLEAPSNFTLNRIVNPTTVDLSWEPVSNESIRGHFKGYKIQTWTEDEGEGRARDIIVENNSEPRSEIDSFVPNVRNYARVLVFNGQYDGPPSESIDFLMPEGTPGPVNSLEAMPLGSSGFLIYWSKPKRTNGNLIGYRIYYQEVDGTNIKDIAERYPPIDDPERDRAKLAKLAPNTKYRLTVRAETNAGVGAPFFIERTTAASSAEPPKKPAFIWHAVDTGSGYSAIKITWIPNVANPGSYFFAKFRRYAESLWTQTKDELLEDFLVIDALEPGQMYEVMVVAVDGIHQTPSDIEEIQTHYQYKSVMVVNHSRNDFATKGWFIGMMLAIAFLLLILVIVCIVKRNRGGKYAVHEREAAHGRSDFNEEGAFPEISPLDGQKRDSLGSDIKQPIESDSDSMAEFAEGDTAGMAEDGSFIGQYGRKKGETSSNAFATLV